ncbi:MAG: hypothetical protein H6Q59_2366 [Firmicutes bacterium]|nr:hypothetical protein [Bacillota bacterium]
MGNRHYLHILQNGQSISITLQERESILEAMLRHGITYPSDCGGRGTCGKCKIRVIEGKLVISTSDRKCLSEKELEEGYRLACKAYPEENITVSLPNRVEDEIQVLTESNRLTSSMYSTQNSVDGYGIGIDLGTTTLALQLMDSTGRILATHSSVNPQRVYGADVISRMRASMEGKRETLRDLIHHSLRTGILKLIREVNIEAELVSQITIAGNTTMIHLLMGYPCDTLGVYPFTPVNLDRIDLTFGELFDEREPITTQKEAEDDWEQGAIGKLQKATVTILPGVGAFVGGDIVAGLGVCDFDRSEKVCLLIDLGTNGELALGNQDKLLVSSTAAGPAFEGGNISCGLASIPGAISRVTIGNEVIHLQTIGDKKPSGICGTGVVELCAELLRSGGMDATGLLKEDYFTQGVPLYEDDQVKITFTQKDVRELQLAKAAIRAGIEVLLSRYGITYSEVDTVYLAGGFGYVLDLAKAVTIGLLPEELQNKVLSVGNTSLSGTLRYNLDSEFAARLLKIVHGATEVHLSNEVNFQEKYLSHINFPGNGIEM